VEFFPWDNFAGILEQKSKNLKRLFLQPDWRATLVQFPRRQIDFECAEANDGMSVAMS
jgi:hypothetical protein